MVNRKINKILVLDISMSTTNLSVVSRLFTLQYEKLLWYISSRFMILVILWVDASLYPWWKDLNQNKFKKKLKKNVIFTYIR